MEPLLTRGAPILSCSHQHLLTEVPQGNLTSLGHFCPALSRERSPQGTSPHSVLSRERFPQGTSPCSVIFISASPHQGPPREPLLAMSSHLLTLSSHRSPQGTSPHSVIFAQHCLERGPPREPLLTQCCLERGSPRAPLLALPLLTKVPPGNLSLPCRSHISIASPHAPLTQVPPGNLSSLSAV
jgi:hypothetical protein